MSFSSHSGLDSVIGIDRNHIMLYDNIPNGIETAEWKRMLDRVVTAGTLNQIRRKTGKGCFGQQDYNVISYFTVVDCMCNDDIYSISIKLISPDNTISKLLAEKAEQNEYTLKPYVMNMRETRKYYYSQKDSNIIKLINYFILLI